MVTAAELPPYGPPETWHIEESGAHCHLKGGEFSVVAECRSLDRFIQLLSRSRDPRYRVSLGARMVEQQLGDTWSSLELQERGQICKKRGERLLAKPPNSEQVLRMAAGCDALFFGRLQSEAQPCWKPSAPLNMDARNAGPSLGLHDWLRVRVSACRREVVRSFEDCLVPAVL